MKWRKKEMPYSNPCESEIHLPDYEEEKGIFESFLDYLPLTFWEEHAQQTNLYSVQKRQHKSVNTSGGEMLHLAGIHVVMGVLGYAQSKLYWQQDIQVPVIAKCMTRDRFYELRNYMHFVDNTSEHIEKLWKVKPFLECVQKKCLTLPRSHHLSIDEQMVPFSGKCGFLTYVPSKPNPLGLKCFILAAPGGLVLDFMFYTGSDTVSAEDKKEYGLGGAVVRMMTESVPRDNQHCVYTDRFFTSVKSVDMLLGRKIYQIGTVMKNSLGPIVKKLKNDRLFQRGEWEEWVREDDKICLIKWKDNKSVLILSSYVGSSPPTTLRGGQENRQRR
ncbi:piggyBac transposable element-derived protein 3-like [Schistocerca americana]|uniref:piggyBac transposable element-derived protein 3-like n=1 Tax=Schistocerca americana TaxID=7009 RepID=UPI001F4FD975|nr:piggyBac transposable element-derived protein 3-like [Schistocerca americana]